MRERQRETERDGETGRQRETERLNNHHWRRKVGGAARFSFHICGYKIEMMSHELLIFYKNCLDIINEYYWNSSSKQIDSFDYLCGTFLWNINNR